MQFLKSLRKTYSIWYLTLIYRTLYNKIGNIIDIIIDSDHDDKKGQVWFSKNKHCDLREATHTKFIVKKCFDFLSVTQLRVTSLSFLDIVTQRAGYLWVVHKAQLQIWWPKCFEQNITTKSIIAGNSKLFLHWV